MVCRNHGSGAFSEDNCSDHLNKTFASSEKSHRALFYLSTFLHAPLPSDDDDGGEDSDDDNPDYDNIKVDYSPV